MIGLHPSIHCYAEHHIQVTGLHRIYVEEVGNPDGIPVLFLHDGPGRGCLPDDRRLFDPKVYRIILFDQRGCGRSTPYASIEDNTTQTVLQDIDRILDHLQIARCALFGEGWGATLALLYAIENNARITGIILHGLFLARRADLIWLFDDQGGASQLFPDHFNALTRLVGGRTLDAVLEGYTALLANDNELEKMQAAKAWVEWQAQIGNPHPEYRHKVDVIDADITLGMASLQCHYFSNDCFIPDQYIEQNLEKLADIQIVMIHGRFDVSHPLGPVYGICQELPLAQLFIVPYAGHFDCEPGLVAALRKATEMMSEIISLQGE